MQSARAPKVHLLQHHTRIVWILCILLSSTVCSTDAENETPSPTLSGCQTCASTGDCSHAYLDGPGQFCGNWLDQSNQRQRCCCPHDATCKVSNYACKCSRPTSVSVSTPGWIGIAFGAMVLLSICGAFCWCCHRTIKRVNRPPPVPMAAPVGKGAVPGSNVIPLAYPAAAPTLGYPAPQGYPTPPGYTAAPVYATAPVYAAAPPVYDYGHGYGNRGYTSGGFGAGLSTVAGLATGMILTNAMMDGFDHGGHRGHGFDGGGGYDGGYDGGGDFGGDGGGGDFGGDF